jgi:hypothetical protein
MAPGPPASIISSPRSRSRFASPQNRRIERRKRPALVVSVLFLGAGSAFTGDDASGPIRYRVDLAAPFTKYELTPANREWSDSFARNLGYSGKVVHFVRTTLELSVNDEVKEGEVYQALEMPDCFYVAPGDAMLRLGSRWPLSPGVGGFSMHAPKSRDFIVCLHCDSGGVPFLSGSRVTRAQVAWGGNSWNRLEEVP